MSFRLIEMICVSYFCLVGYVVYRFLEVSQLLTDYTYVVTVLVGVLAMILILVVVDLSLRRAVSKSDSGMHAAFSELAKAHKENLDLIGELYGKLSKGSDFDDDDRRRSD